MNQKPVALSLFLCENVIIEERTRNVTPVNCFTHRSLKSFPADPFPFYAFANLTDARGDMLGEVVVEKLDASDEIHRAEFLCRFSDPLLTYRLILRIHDCTFPEPGAYQVALFVDHDLIALRKLVLQEKGT